MPAASACPSCGAPVAAERRAGGLCAACLLDRVLLDDVESDGDVEATDLASGSLFGGLRIVRLLGKGGMASVYEAYDARLDRAVAVKVLPAQFLHDEAFARRFEQEARLVARLAHPHIVPVYTSGIAQGIPWMTMRLFAGGSVDRLLCGEPLSTPVALRLLADVASALDHAHASGVIHRDIKSTNILLDEDGSAALSDFGLARALIGGRALTRIGSTAGTPQYMSPEQALGSNVDHRSDIYSLGIVAYELLTGQVPFDDGAPMAVLLKHVNEAVPEPENRSLTGSSLAAVAKALAKRPADRWATATEFIAALRLAVEAEDRASRPAPADRRYKIAGGLIWFGSVIAALLVVLASDVRKDTAPATIPAPGVVRPQVEAPEPARVTGARLAGADAVTRRPSLDRPPAPTSSPAGTGVGQSPGGPTAVSPGGVAGPAPAPSSGDMREAGRADPPPSRGPLEAQFAAAERDPALVIDEPTVPASARGDRVIEPVRVRREPPLYPPLARAAAIEGDVLMMARVGTDGTVTAVDVLQAPHPLLADAARKAVLRYRYTPGSRNGVPAVFSVRVTIRFRLE